MSYETLLVENSGPIVTVSINRPKALNALNEQVLKDLKSCFESFKANKEIKAVIVTGSGEKAFVAGADIVSMQEMKPLEAQKFVELGHDCMKTIENLSVPVVAAVNGFALGGGLELALACDFIYASETAALGLPEVNLGIFPGFGGTQRLPRLIGTNRAKELIFTAQIIKAQDAYTMGLVNKVVAADKLMDEVNKTLNVILEKGPIAIQLAKKVINEGFDLDINSALSFEALSFPIVFSTDDKREGITAFLEKRKAEFKGE